ncbi:hypothetical protein [Luteolibacter sp. Populi]|uniref:hypothetical protein n=1 Tax=Luteolibacter sp. Populi TaxID=3230487 RepID=UPI003465D45F
MNLPSRNYWVRGLLHLLSAFSATTSGFLALFCAFVLVLMWPNLHFVDPTHLLIAGFGILSVACGLLTTVFLMDNHSARKLLWLILPAAAFAGFLGSPALLGVKGLFH